MNAKVVDPSGMTMEELMHENLVVLSKGHMIDAWFAHGSKEDGYFDRVKEIINDNKNAGILLRIIPD